MRICSYNILTGGEGRADPIAEVIQAQHADVIAIIEANDPAVLDRIARRLKMDFVQAIGKEGKAVALLSRFAIRDSINHGAMSAQSAKSLLQATVVDSKQTAWHFGVVHLHPRVGEEDERTRESELESILPVFKPLREAGTPHFLLGDFNANSPMQQIDLTACKPSTREQATATGGRIPRRAVRRLFDDGYIDTYAALHPEKARLDGTFTTQFPGQRVDYIFAHSLTPARLKSAWIEYDRLAKYASDHFPIGIEVE